MRMIAKDGVGYHWVIESPALPRIRRKLTFAKGVAVSTFAQTGHTEVYDGAQEPYRTHVVKDEVANCFENTPVLQNGFFGLCSDGNSPHRRPDRIDRPHRVGFLCHQG